MVGLSRRKFLVAGAAGTGGGLAAGAVGFGVGTSLGGDDVAGASPSKGTEPFYGRHQSGIATAQQDRLLFAAYDLTTDNPDDVRQVLAKWTAAAARLTAGHEVAADAASDLAPPSDTGEATGLDPAHLTLTFGFGPGLFTKLGLEAQRPAALADLPAFPGDDLDPAHSDGDLCVQACSNDPQVAYHAVRNLTRLARGHAVLRWTQEGFGRTSATTPDQVTPRNLMGFKDGTNNLRTDAPDFADQVWVGAKEGPDWMVGGSYLVARRIRMHIEVWDRSSLQDQEQTIGRTKVAGAPLGAHQEHDTVKPKKLPVDAHVRLAHQDTTKLFLLRRGYSFTDGIDPQTGQLDAGLFFLAYQRDPRKQFVALQEKLAQADALNEYIQHVGSAVFAIPPGIRRRGDVLGAGVFRQSS